jgi:hypothetical protein
MKDATDRVRDLWWGMRLIARLPGALVGAGYAWCGVSAVTRGGWGSRSAEALFWLLALPLGVFAGYLIAWRRELLGAVIALVCLIVTFGGAAPGGASSPAIPHLHALGAAPLVFTSVRGFSPRKEGRASRRGGGQ